VIFGTFPTPQRRGNNSRKACNGQAAETADLKKRSGYIFWTFPENVLGGGAFPENV
jgi:hypothetical protein